MTEEIATTSTHFPLFVFSLSLCTVLAICIRGWNTKAISPSGLPFKMKAIPGAGFGMVATRPILRGTLILSESPLFTIHGDFSNLAKTTAAIEAKISTLSEDQKQVFFALHNSQDSSMSTTTGIVKTNAHPLGVGARDCGIFPVCSRFNHSCASNSSYTWVATTAQEAIYSGKDIKEGEQITVNYLHEYHLHQKRSDRRAAIMERFRFECNCNVCGSSPRDVAASDRRRLEIARLDAAIGGGMLVMMDPARCLGHCRSILRLYKEEGMNHDSQFKTYNDAFQVCVTHGDLARASAFASLAVARAGVGDPSIEHVRPFIEHPESHQYAGMSNLWRTEKKSARKADEKGFEKWLWQRAV